MEMEAPFDGLLSPLVGEKRRLFGGKLGLKSKNTKNGLLTQSPFGLDE